MKEKSLFKCRAWDKTTNQMRGCYGFNELEREVYVCSVADDEFNGQLKTVHALKRSFDEVVVMQSTGLKDKDGVEIYEGDILYHPLQGVRKVFYPYSESVASYGLREISTGFGSTLQDAHAVWQVIGNIYQNQELLETKPYSEESEEE